MNHKKTDKPHRRAGWLVLLVLFIIIAAGILELGKHTLAGWILTAVLVFVFITVRVKKMQQAGRLKRFVSWIVLTGLFALILWVSWPPFRAVPAVRAADPQPTGIVHTEQGDLTGVYTEDSAVEVYAGIPYAMPPVGELRWKEPQPAEPWDGVLAADHFAPMSMQSLHLPIYNSLEQIIGFHDYRISLSDNYREPVSEDSLYLNIWKPAGEAGKLPVLVYIHGGSLQTGQPSYADYSGEGLARHGVLVVNMGYRLGIFGFFADEELAAESPNGTTGNYGLLDQIMALQWVQDNIEAFGGDPDNVTLAGESAGSACVSALCTSPLAKGLFRRAVGESSTVTSPKPPHSFRTMGKALEAGQKTKETFGTAGRTATVAELRELPADKIVDEMKTHHHLTVDGYVLEETPYESYRKGIHNEEAQLHGYNKEESAPFILFSQADLKNYEQKIRDAFEEPYASEILALFPAASDEEARQNWENIYTALLFSYGHFCWERQALDNGIPSYVYYFTKENGRLGCWHSGEEIYLYGNIPEDSKLYDTGDRELSAAMLQYLCNFVRYGDPNGEGHTPDTAGEDLSGENDAADTESDASDSGKLPIWPPADGTFMAQEFGEEIRQTEEPYQDLYAIFDEIYKFNSVGESPVSIGGGF